MSMMVHRHYGAQNEDKNITTLSDITPTADGETIDDVENYVGNHENTAQRRGRPPKNR